MAPSWRVAAPRTGVGAVSCNDRATVYGSNVHRPRRRVRESRAASTSLGSPASVKRSVSRSTSGAGTWPMDRSNGS